MAGGLTFASAPLDLRGLPPPEPMEQILHHLHTLPPGERLVALTPMKPLPLLPLLQQLHARYGESVEVSYRHRGADGVMIDFIRR